MKPHVYRPFPPVRPVAQNKISLTPTVQQKPDVGSRAGVPAPLAYRPQATPQAKMGLSHGNAIMAGPPPVYQPNRPVTPTKISPAQTVQQKNAPAARIGPAAPPVRGPQVAAQAKIGSPGNRITAGPPVFRPSVPSQPVYISKISPTQAVQQKTASGVHRTSRVTGPSSNTVVQRARMIWVGPGEDDYIFASSFSDGQNPPGWAILDAGHGVITQAHQGSSLYFGSHSELFVEYLAHEYHETEQIHLSNDRVQSKSYNWSSPQAKSRLVRTASWRVSMDQIREAKEVAKKIDQKFQSGALKYAYFFGTTDWKNATVQDPASMSCKDVTDAILIELGLLQRTAWTHAFNKPANIAGHSTRMGATAPDGTWETPDWL
jgi:hypothetical protein